MACLCHCPPASFYICHKSANDELMKAKLRAVGLNELLDVVRIILKTFLKHTLPSTPPTVETSSLKVGFAIASALLPLKVFASTYSFHAPSQACPLFDSQIAKWIEIRVNA